MDNNNPAEMSNEDLEKDTQQRNLETPKGNQEKLNKSTAAEGMLKTPEEDESSKINRDTVYKADSEQDMDDLMHTRANEKEINHNGSMPDPEEVGNWENNEDNNNKFSG